MRALIEAVQRSAPPSRRRRASSIELAADAARRALEVPGVDAARIDLVVNAGVYRDEHICEPALAPLIQKRIGALARRTDVFSFDLANGACGLVDALQVVDAFARTGSVRGALVVASDVDPDPGRSTGLALGAAGVAIVVGAGAGPEGFLGFHAETFSKHAHLCESRLDWKGPAGVPRGSSGGGHTLVLRTLDAYAERCAESAALAAARFLDGQGLGIEDVDLLVAPGVPAGLPERLAALLGIPAERVADAASSVGACSAAPGLALEAAVASGRLRAARRALLVAVGAGISVSLALYGR
jgi:3-oxoacyl-[acyl-carrier-protein] synthase-3